MPFPNPDTQFRPGGPGGPGRPRSRAIADRLTEALEQADGAGKTAADRIVSRLIAQAEAGDMAAVRELFTRAYGRPPAAAPPESGPVEITVVYVDEPQPDPCRPAGDPPPWEEVPCSPSRNSLGADAAGAGASPDSAGTAPSGRPAP